MVYVRNIMDVVCFLLLLLLVCCSFSKNNNFMDIRKIVVTHFKTFKGCKFQFASLFVTPLFFSIMFVMHYEEDLKNFDNVSTNINTIIVVMTILLSMFFALLGILCTLTIKSENSNYSNVVKETFNSTLFEILICIVIIILSIILLFVGKNCSWYINFIVFFIICYFTLIALLNIFVLLKRIRNIFNSYYDMMQKEDL